MKRALLITGLSALLAAEAAAEDFGRLFFTPEQRAALDARRRARVPDKPAAVVVASPTTRVDGYVKRSSGPSTVFVNREALTVSGQADSPRTPGDGDSRVAIPVGEAGSHVGLKPGEVLDRGSGEVRNSIGDGQVRVRPASPAK